ncbi:hypothetical protein [Veillonella sp.]|uniref:hypothetical protein n=1 Tax=Veillonella sp. TaxID=1926307 RepID=UPI0025EB2AE5|nr:hypothetical protein [Veillonella sp.]
MSAFLGFLGLIVIIWCIIGMFIPKKVAPFFKAHRRKWIILTSFILLVICGALLPESNSNTTPSATTTQSAQDKEKQKSDANTSAINILSSVAQENDQVEKKTIYKSWGNDSYPASTNLYWYAIEKDKKVTEYLKLVHFTTGINWVFWDTLIFSTDQGKWEYKIGSFAGQSGNGKNTEIVMGGKYETLDVTYDKLRPGIKLLVEGTNPIIRLKGTQYQEDFHIPAETIEQMKSAQQLDQDLDILDNKLK